MKIIDILNTIARGETPPKKIMYKGTIWEYKENEKDYSSVEWNEWLFDVYLITEILNDYIEILETTITYTPNELKWGGKIKKIERCDEHDMTDYGEIYKPRFNEEILRRKINEIIDYINKDQV